MTLSAESATLDCKWLTDKDAVQQARFAGGDEGGPHLLPRLVRSKPLLVGVIASLVFSLMRGAPR